MSCIRHTTDSPRLYDNLAFATARAQVCGMAVPTSPRQLACARCGVSFECGLGSNCWCAAESYRLPMTKAWLEDCLCPACLRKAASALAESRREAEQGQ